MRSILDSITSLGRNRTPRYRLFDTWMPSLDAELKLSASSFYADEAFHQVFGNHRQLQEQAVMWHFIGLVLRERYDPIRHVVTVRRNRRLVALTSGSLDCGSDKVDELVEAIQSRKLPIKPRRILNPDNHEVRQASIALDYRAAKDDALEARLKSYFDLIQEAQASEKDEPMFYMLKKVAVDTDEQGKGHVRTMLDKIIERYQDYEQVEHIEVSTYDAAKVDLYMHLGFRSPREFTTDDLTAWRLIMPLRT